MARKRIPAKTTDRTRINITLNADTRKRLGAFAAWHGRTDSQVIEAAVVEVLRGFIVSSRPPAAADVPAPVAVLPLREVG